LLEEAQPAASRPGSRAAQTAVPPGREPGRADKGRQAGRPLAVKASGKKAEITVEKLGRVARNALEEEAQRVADLRGALELLLVVD